jgi:small GTP-binding protein
MSNKKKVLKIAVTGLNNIGKTCLCQILTGEDPNIEYNRTIGVDFMVNFFNNYNIKLCFWDFGGYDRFEIITYSYIRNVDLIIFVYNIYDYSSVYKIKNLYNTYKQHGWDSKSIIVGNNVIRKGENLKNRFVREADIFAQENFLPHVLIDTRKREGINVLTHEIFMTSNVYRTSNNDGKKNNKNKFRDYCINFLNSLIELFK